MKRRRLSQTDTRTVHIRDVYTRGGGQIPVTATITIPPEIYSPTEKPTTILYEINDVTVQPPDTILLHTEVKIPPVPFPEIIISFPSLTTTTHKHLSQIVRETLQDTTVVMSVTEPPYNERTTKTSVVAFYPYVGRQTAASPLDITPTKSTFSPDLPNIIETYINTLLENISKKLESVVIVPPPDKPLTQINFDVKVEMKYLSNKREWWETIHSFTLPLPIERIKREGLEKFISPRSIVTYTYIIEGKVIDELKEVIPMSYWGNIDAFSQLVEVKITETAHQKLQSIIGQIKGEGKLPPSGVKNNE